MRRPSSWLTSAFAVGLIASLGSADAATTTYNSSHSHMMTGIAARASPDAEIAATQEAHRKAMGNKAYTEAIVAKNSDRVRMILVRNGAPSDLRVRFDDKRHPGTSSERLKISITVTCCPLMITISIR